MTVKGFQLPTAFVELIRQGGIPVSTNEHHPVDAYGNRWQGQLELYISPSDIESETDALGQFYAADPDEPAPGPPTQFPGFIPYISDFSQRGRAATKRKQAARLNLLGARRN